MMAAILVEGVTMDALDAVRLPVFGNPGEVWRLGYAADPWQWPPWRFAFGNGRFNGRWDDQNADSRTLCRRKASWAASSSSSPRSARTAPRTAS
jgi:hypothetical protein